MNSFEVITISSDDDNNSDCSSNLNVRLDNVQICLKEEIIVISSDDENNSNCSSNLITRLDNLKIYPEEKEMKIISSDEDNSSNFSSSSSVILDTLYAYSENEEPETISATDIAPKPDYSGYSFDELTNLCNSYGLRKLTKANMIKELNLIWERKNKPVNILSIPNTSQNANWLIEETLTSELELELNKFLQAQPDIIEKILKFIPIDIDIVYNRYITSSYELKLSKKLLKAYLDKKGILFGNLNSTWNKI